MHSCVCAGAVVGLIAALLALLFIQIHKIFGRLVKLLGLHVSLLLPCCDCTCFYKLVTMSSLDMQHKCDCIARQNMLYCNQGLAGCPKPHAVGDLAESIWVGFQGYRMNMA